MTKYIDISAHTTNTSSSSGGGGGVPSVTYSAVNNLTSVGGSLITSGTLESIGDGTFRNNINAKNGVFTGIIDASGATIRNGLTANSLSTTGLTVSGDTSLQNTSTNALNCNTLNSSGSTVLSSLRAGATTVSSLNSTGASTFSTISGVSINTSGSASFGPLTAGLSRLGTVISSGITATSLSSTGSVSAGSLVIGGLSTTGSLSTGTLTATGDTSLSTVTAGTVTVSGIKAIYTLISTGPTTLTSVTAGAISSTSLSTGAISSTSLSTGIINANNKITTPEITTGTLAVSSSLDVVGTVLVSKIYEKNTIMDSTTLICDMALGSLFALPLSFTPTSNFSISIINVPINTGQTYSINIMMRQATTSFYISNLKATDTLGNYIIGTVNSVSSPLWNGGSPSLANSPCVILQSFNIVSLPNSSNPLGVYTRFVCSSVNSHY